MEEWRAISGYPNYEASDEGQIRRSPSAPAGGATQKAGKIAHQRIRDGYPVVSIDCQDLYVHRLVCAAFHGSAQHTGLVVRHLDDDKTHNAPGNLAWGTHTDNMHDAIRNGLRPDLARRFDRAEAAAMRDAGVPWVRIAAAMGVSDVAVRKGVMAHRATLG